MRYAACDALASVLIFKSMVRMKFGTSGSDANSVIAAQAKSLCQGIVDLRYSAKTSDGHHLSEKVSGFLCFEGSCLFGTFHCHLDGVLAQW